MIALWIAAAAAQAVAAPAPAMPTAPNPMVSTAPGAILLPEGTPIRLMILREINTHGAKLGDRFKLRVDEPVFINGLPAVPVGATAWGEISMVEQNGAVGKGGKLSARLLYLDLPTGRIPLRGSYSRKGDGNGAGVVLAVIGFGIPGLFMGGDSGRLKAGDTFTGFVAGAPTPASSAAAGDGASPPPPQ